MRSQHVRLELPSGVGDDRIGANHAPGWRHADGDPAGSRHYGEEGHGGRAVRVVEGISGEKGRSRPALNSSGNVFAS